MATGVHKRQILNELSAGPLTTAEISVRLLLSDGTARSYLHLLRRDGAVERRDGRWHRTDDDGTAGAPAKPSPRLPSLPASFKREIDGI